MTSVVADTHTIIWYLVEPDRLSDNALSALDQATNTGQTIYVSAISIVEICYLVERGRLPELVLQSLLDVCDNTEAVVIPISLNRAIAEKIREIPRDCVPDMPDRIIAATALYLNLPLVTRDKKIQSLEEIQIIW
jgi:PIN domain nuclease of toxin-antitoxin system